MLVLIDNYDSFVYNIYQILAQTRSCEVYRNDALSVDAVLALRPQAVVLSPGPGHPRDAGICLDLIPALAEHKIPMLGVCLGHQALACALGGSLKSAPQLMHGKVSAIEHSQTGLFAGQAQPMQVTRYHSLIVDPATLPTELEVTARSVDGCIMGLQHRSLPLYGVQFHPESMATVGGVGLVQQFLKQIPQEAQ